MRIYYEDVAQPASNNGRMHACIIIVVVVVVVATHVTRQASSRDSAVLAYAVVIRRNHNYNYNTTATWS
jgi:cell division protein FtsL